MMKMSKGLHVFGFTSGHSIHLVTVAVINHCWRREKSDKNLVVSNFRSEL